MTNRILSTQPARRTRRLRLAMTLAALLPMLLVAACGGSSGGDRADLRNVPATDKGTVIPVDQRVQAGRLVGTQLDGAEFDLAAMRARVVFINFWGSWCGPCAIETPMLDRISREYDSASVTFLGIAVKDDRSATEAFIERNSISFPIIFDYNAKSAVQLGNLAMRGLPSSVVIDQQGRVAGVYIGVVQTGDVRPVLEALLAEQ